MNRFKKQLKQELFEYLYDEDNAISKGCKNPLDANVILEASRKSFYTYERVELEDGVMHVLRPSREDALTFTMKGG